MLLSIGTCLQLLSAMWVICRLVDSKTGSQVGPDTFKDTDESLTLGAVFHTLEAPTGLSVKKVYLSATGKPSDSWTAAELTHPVSLSSQFGKPYLKFMVEAVQPALNSEGNENAFDRLMAGARRLSEEARQARMPHLPDTKDSSSPGYTQKDALYNYIILDVLKKNSLLFENKHVADTDGTMLLRVLTDVLWNIDEHHEKINHRATFSAEIFPIPERFASCRGFNDSRRKKHAVRLERKTVESLTSNLFQVLSLGLYWNEEWSRFHADLERLAKCLRFYVDNLEKENRSQQLRQSQLTVALRPFDVIDVKAACTVAPVYKDLNDATLNSSEYEVIHADQLAPTEKSKRYFFFKNLSLSRPVQLYRYHQSGSLGTLNFIWVVPEDHKERSNSKMVANIEQIKQTIPTYHTRALRREFKEKFNRIAKVPPVVLAEMYRTLTSDATAVPNPSIAERLRQFIEADYDYLSDESVVVDLRQLNEGKISKFDTFWLHLEQVLQDYCEAAADDRRHGEARMPVAISIPDLKRQVVEKIPSELKDTTPVPSDECMRLQFMPMNQHAQSSVKFTKRFNLRFKVQRRCLRLNHEDCHYTATLFKYLKHFSVQYRDHTLLLSCDDKHNIQVGEPQHAVAALDRGKRVLGHEGIPILALDHDFTKAKVTPSVSLVIDIPASPSETFYRGKVYTHVKDSIFSPSSPLVHCSELEDILSASCPGGNVPPILALYTDGGPDHRPTYGSVQVALLGVFKRYDLDMLVACRTAPGQSFINPVERIMSLLNLALQGIALERSPMAAEYEDLLKSCSSMAEIRETAAKTPSLQSAYVNSVQPCIDLIVSRFNRLSLKEERVCAMSSCADDDDLDCLFSFAKLIDSDLTRDMTTKKELILRTKYQEFLRTHAIAHHYCFQIKKCGSDACEYCTPPRCSLDVFQTLSFVPDPLLDTTGSKFKPFEDLYGKEPNSEKDRPSLGTPAERHDHESRDLLVSTKARMTVACCQCNKPRVVYSPLRLQQAVQKFVHDLAEFLQYSCGSPLYYELPENWSVELKQNSPIVRENMTCSTPVEFAYYSSHKFPDVCAHCGDRDCTIISELKHSFQTVLPICLQCRSTKEPVTRGKFKHPSSSDKGSSAKRARLSN